MALALNDIKAQTRAAAAISLLPVTPAGSHNAIFPQNLLYLYSLFLFFSFWTFTFCLLFLYIWHMIANTVVLTVLTL
jgi:hypothetical protein